MAAVVGAVTVIGRDPDFALLEEFRGLPQRWQDEVILTVAKRRPGLLEEVLGDVDLCRVTTAALYGGTP